MIDSGVNDLSSGAGTYPGWKVVVALFVAGMMVYGAGLYAFTLMIPPLSAEFGWSRALTGGLVSVFWLTAPLTPLGGLAIARYGAWRIVCAGVLIASVCMALVAVTSSLPLMYFLRALMGLGKVMMMAGVTAQASAWFRRRFGLAIAICFAGWHFGGLTLSLLAQYLIDHAGWRSACLVLGILIAALALPPMLIWGRRSPPADLGSEKQSVLAAPNADIWEPRAVLRAPDFWILIAITVAASYPYGALLTHQAALAQDVGISPGTAAISLSVTAGAALVGSMLIGYLSDHFRFRFVMALELGFMLGGAVGMYLLTTHSSIALLIASAASFGLSVGGIDTGMVTQLQRRFGARSFSHVFGVWYFFYLATLFAGPILAGHLFDVTHSYTSAVMYTLIALFISFVLLAALRSPPAQLRAT